MPYDLKSLSLPRLEGGMLALAAAVFEMPLVGRALLRRLLHDAGIARARELRLQELPTVIVERPYPANGGGAIRVDYLRDVPHGDVPQSARLRVRDFAAAYRSGAASPEQVAEAVLAGIERSDAGPKPMRAFASVLRDDVLAQARASALRYRAGNPLSVLDGVPVAVKDELDQVPHPTTLGTAFRRDPAKADAAVVERLRALGALLIGKTTMHEIGINPTGANTHFGHVRNPCGEDRDPGGSSSGSAAAVGAGICPIAIGADGGGSIRIPAAHCGVVGLKPTFGRVSHRGVPALAYTVGALGPIAGSVEDAAIGYAAMAGEDPQLGSLLAQPAPTLARYETRDITGVRIGIYRPWFEHAQKDIVSACDGAVQQLVARGASLVEIEIPEMDAMRVAHGITILCEMAASLRTLVPEWERLSPLARVSADITRVLEGADYVWAQRMRTRALAHHTRVFRECDVVASPASAITAPRIPASGAPWSDLGVVTEVMRFIIAANFLGYPAISVPVGHDADGMPIGLQLMARHWEEDLLLGLSAAVERGSDAEPPRGMFRPL